MGDAVEGVPEHGWTCFHCWEHFPGTGEGQRQAQYHFGYRPTHRPVCLLAGVGERKLLRMIRYLERRLAETEEAFSNYRMSNDNG